MTDMYYEKQFSFQANAPARFLLRTQAILKNTCQKCSLVMTQRSLEHAVLYCDIFAHYYEWFNEYYEYGSI